LISAILPLVFDSFLSMAQSPRLGNDYDSNQLSHEDNFGIDASLICVETLGERKKKRRKKTKNSPNKITTRV